MLTNTRTTILVGAVYLLACFIHAPSSEVGFQGTPYWKAGPLVVGPPRVLSGDSPHYLVAVNSLIEDGDFDLRNNYDEALAGDFDAGIRFRGVALDRHIDTDAQERELGTHSPFFALALATFAWPLAHTAWVEPLCVLLTCLCGLGAVLLLLHRCAPGADYRLWILVVAFASPLLCYSRDVWTEPWIALIWMSLVTTKNRSLQFGLALVGTLLKYPFAVVPLTWGLIALGRRQARLGWTLLCASGLGVAVAALSVQWIFSDVESHWSLFHSGIHAGFRMHLTGFAGLLFSPENGLIFFFPVLLWFLPADRTDLERWLPILAFMAVHALYVDWRGGTGFSARYLVPAIPVLFLTARSVPRPRGLFRMAAAYSIVWGLLAGFFPPLVFDRSPLGVVNHIWARL